MLCNFVAHGASCDNLIYRAGGASFIAARFITATENPTILRIRRRLERWELEHLRRLAADLHERIEQLNERIELAEEYAQRAWEMAEFWQRHAAELQHELCDAGGQISLTTDGQLIVHTPAQEQHAP